MKKSHFTQAFTLVELIVVMVIIMIVAGLVVSVGKAARTRARVARAQAMIATLEIAAGMYEADVGSYPPTDGGAQCLNLLDHLTDVDEHGPGGTAPLSGWRGPYAEFKSQDISGNNIIDPWGNAYRYDEPGTNNTQSFDLWSVGPDDGATATSDDINNW